MDLDEGISQEDLKLFLQEADEQLQLLDEDFVKLEQEANDSSLLQEIFRAAHTLKGSSAMIGHQRMSELAHAMENILDRVRKGTLSITPPVVDALLKSLDVMRNLKLELSSPGAEKVDITPAVAILEASTTGPEITESKATNTGSTLVLDIDSVSRLDQALAIGAKAFKVKVVINKETIWAAVRCFQALQQLSTVGDIITSVPSKQEIEQEKVDYNLEVLIVTNGDETTIRSAVNSILEIESIEITHYGNEEVIKAAGNGPVVPDKASIGKEETKLSQTVRVDVDRLDTLMEQVGELVINRNRISQIGKILGEKYHDDELIHDLGDTLSQIGKIVSMLQQDVMTIRMLPIEIVFNTLPRLVRDLARKTGKNVNFRIEGQETEVDRSVIEHLRDPLVHLLRNCVDHGIETPEERITAGKAETGTIRLSAHHQEDNIIITVADDGKGISPNSIKEAAVRKNLISSEEAITLTDTEALDLIFLSGVSTAKTVSEVSGRGVGMDIVKKNVEIMGGSVAVVSKIGEGTKFTLTLPLTLAIIPALLVSVGSTTCAISLSSIVEAGKLEASDIKTVRGREVTMVRGNILPLLRLGSIFGWETVGNITNTTRTNYVVVVKAGDMQVGLIVDSLIEQQELVVKSLDELVGGTNGITGASILGDGQVVLILDIASLVKGEIVRMQKNNTESGNASMYSLARR
jgi:two-component system chemotaxis sensor kinase CheA